MGPQKTEYGASEIHPVDPGAVRTAGVDKLVLVCIYILRSPRIQYQVLHIFFFLVIVLVGKKLAACAIRNLRPEFDPSLQGGRCGAAKDEKIPGQMV